MGKRRQVKEHIGSLKEILSIMDAMKSLAMMESHKLARYHKHQQQLTDSVRHALLQVSGHYADEEQDLNTQPLYLLIGSERGFCGAYNEQLLTCLEQQSPPPQSPIIGVGSRLAGPLARDYPDAIALPGASVADEVANLLSRLLNTINQLRKEHGPIHLEVIHFQPEQHRPQCQKLLPPGPGQSRGVPPLINLPPEQLLEELLEHYLFALTHTWLYAALLAENQQRMQHLEQAGNHLEQQLDSLAMHNNTLRQEEIIEEIEVILLNSAVQGMGDGETGNGWQ